jgi:hypothetical protein
MWRLYADQNPQKEGQQKDGNPVFEFKLKNVNFSCVVSKQDTKNAVFAVGTDKTVKELQGAKEQFKEVYPRYDAGVNVS